MTMTDTPEPTVCRFTGERVSAGVCPIHHGDACLVFLPALLADYDRLRYSLATDPRPVSPEAAPPRATTPEPMTEQDEANLREYLNDPDAYMVSADEARAMVATIDRLRASLSAAPSQEIGGLLAQARAYARAASRADQGEDGADIERRQTYAALSRSVEALHAELQRVYAANAENGRLYREAEDALARSSVDAREAERLRAALEGLIAACEEVNSRYVGGSPLKGRLGDALEALADTYMRARASLRATPPETTTQETKP
jgi:hypothetical protein